jgi:glucose-1-phosphate thymidylyltransferase
MQRGDLDMQVLSRGFAWLDTGTHESLLEAAQFVETIEKRQGYKIACLEEIALKAGWMTADQVRERATMMSKNGYGEYLVALIRMHPLR